MFKRFMAGILSFLLIFSNTFAQVSKQVNTDVSAELVKAPSAILMEQTTKQVLYELDADRKMPIASVTKTMTMLLIMEAIDSGKIKYSDMVTTSEHAASMGGSQVFLEVGEQMSVDEMLKSIAVSSGNDAAVAMAEHISGTEEAFVEQMNKKAEKLGAKNTHFINCNGLDETEEHYSTARDVALISAELLKHPDIEKYLTIWMDTIRNGQFGLSNTNKLIRFYEGANGIKTGSTSVAKYCLSASAKRNNMQLIAVVLGAPSTADRFSSASKLLDFGFANYAIADNSSFKAKIPEIKVVGGTENQVEAEISGGLNAIVRKGNQNKITVKVKTEDKLSAPVKKGDKVGEAIFFVDGEELTKKSVVAKTDVDRINCFQMFVRCLKKWATLY
ncbi:MAG: D-alanyl-D-alanine carboxypeptidase [Ruminococcaceae bacterium]|nr:D-alanyl-D-alanine carboxypeptidase [Oscillospiraceae bacterium]